MVLLGCLLCPAAWSQEGDRKDPAGMVQEELWRRYDMPPAPVLPPEKALESFSLPEGFRIELVASEPLVGDPVEIEFDSDGRMWVVEMRGYMPNPDGTHENEPVGRITVLEDDDGDGRMDRSTVFLDQLVMPRALCVMESGVLVAEPPNLWHCRDLDGDLRCDERRLLTDRYAVQNDPRLGVRSNPEHASNGLLWAMDNWIYSANHTTRYRFLHGRFEEEPTIFRGQWGLSHDNFGRFFYNTNSDHFRGDLVPHGYLQRNPHFQGLAGANVRINPDQTVWPGRLNLGVNRGYRSGTLREDGTLRRYTGACGTLVYRGGNFPEEFVGDGFVCEPTANLIRCNRVSESSGVVSAVNAYPGGEFLTSTDERFRPVNLINGPDGALYVVDLHRGLIQHRIYLTTFLRKQIEERGLDAPTGLGRIYRIVHEGRDREAAPPMGDMASPDLVGELGSVHGWRRDTAQRILVERQDAAVIGPLREAALSASPLARIHALWTLHGLGGLDEKVVAAGLVSHHPKVRTAALRVSESLKELVGEERLLSLWRPALDDIPEVQWQLAFSLGELDGEKATGMLALVLERNLLHPYIPGAVYSSLHRREGEFLQRLIDAGSLWDRDMPGVASVVESLSGAVFRERQASRIRRILDRAVDDAEPEWRRHARMTGLHRAAFRRVQGRLRLQGEPVRVDAMPDALASLVGSRSPRISILAEELVEAFDWPGKDQPGDEDEVVALTLAQKIRFQEGSELYVLVCGTCHQPDGRGLDGLAPPILNSERILGSKERLVRIVLHGLQGPIEVEGREWDMTMPGLAVLDDHQISGLLTYVRREWGHEGTPVDPGEVSRVRDEYADRLDMWTVEELEE